MRSCGYTPSERESGCVFHPHSSRRDRNHFVAVTQKHEPNISKKKNFDLRARAQFGRTAGLKHAKPRRNSFFFPDDDTWYYCCFRIKTLKKKAASHEGLFFGGLRTEIFLLAAQIFLRKVKEIEPVLLGISPTTLGRGTQISLPLFEGHSSEDFGMLIAPFSKFLAINRKTKVD